MSTTIDLKLHFIRAHLEQPLVIIGLMGAGKTSIGKMLAAELDYDFIDSDEMIVKREQRSILDIFAQSGEPHFREVERAVIQDLMLDVAPHVIGTGGGAFMNAETRAAIKETGVSIFLKASLDVLAERVGNGEGRPLLTAGNSPREVLDKLMQDRYPIYAEADLAVETRAETQKETLNRVINALYTHLKP